VLISDSTSASILLENNTLKISGELSLKGVNQLLNEIEDTLRNYSGGTLLINLDDLKYVDSAGITAIYYLNDKYAGKGLSVNIEGGSENIRRKLELFRLEKSDRTDPGHVTGFFESLGNFTSYLFNEYVIGFFQIAADITYWSVADLFRKQMRRKGESVNQALLIGVYAVPIVGAMSFIIGFVLALQ
jgi:phospholipid/cholesterol/gamma-HCH transport system permease protein